MLTCGFKWNCMLLYLQVTEWAASAKRLTPIRYQIWGHLHRRSCQVNTNQTLTQSKWRMGGILSQSDITFLKQFHLHFFTTLFQKFLSLRKNTIWNITALQEIFAFSFQLYLFLRCKSLIFFSSSHSENLEDPTLISWLERSPDVTSGVLGSSRIEVLYWSKKSVFKETFQVKCNNLRLFCHKPYAKKVLGSGLKYYHIPRTPDPNTPLFSNTATWFLHPREVTALSSNMWPNSSRHCSLSTTPPTLADGM